MRCRLAGRIAQWLDIDAQALLLAQTASVCKGSCDASAAVVLAANHFVVGNDETNDACPKSPHTDPLVAVTMSAFLGTGAQGESSI